MSSYLNPLLIPKRTAAIDAGPMPGFVSLGHAFPITAKTMDIGQLKNILNEMMADVEGDLPTPDLKIVNHARPDWGGMCLWTLGTPNTVIEIQKSVTADERSFRRILAHELCHHEQYLVYWSGYTHQNFKSMTKLEGGHGRIFRKIMDRWNARHGKDFVTVTSDKDIVTEHEEKLFFVFMQRFFGGRPIWQASIRLTGRQLRYMAGKRQDSYKLVQTNDRRFINAPVIGSDKGWQYLPMGEHEWEEAALRLWGQPDLRMQWEVKPPATKEEERVLQERQREEEREKSRRHYEELVTSLKRMREGKTSASRDTTPTPEVLDEARQIRTEEREGDSRSAEDMERSYGSIATLAADRFGWDMEQGLYIHEGKAYDHVWDALGDGTVVDVSHDRFGEPDIAVARPGTEEHARYHRYCWSYRPQEEADACPVCNPPGSVAKAADSHKQAFVRRDLSWLKDYLTMTRPQMGEELARQWHTHFIEWLAETEPDILEGLGAKPDEEDGEFYRLEEFEEDFIDKDMFGSIPPDVYARFLEDGGSYIMQNDPAEAPSFLHMSYKGIVRNQWLVHFTDHPDEIARDGFTIGMDDLSKLGLTTFYNEKGKRGGYNFAVPAGETRSIKNLHFGKHAVLFRASGLMTYHSGDEFYQVIFWGRDARDIIPIHRVYDDWCLPDGGSGRPLFQSEDIQKTVDWAIANFSQYRRALSPGQHPKAADSHKQTPHRENVFEDIGQGEGTEGYALQPECVEGTKSGLGIEEIARQVEMSEVRDR